MGSLPDEDGFQTKADLRRLFEEGGISPRKRFGQNFLIDRNLMGKLVSSAEIGGGDCVLEVGAGMGSLTMALARRAGRVVAVEIDRALAALARERLAAYENTSVLNVDALASKSTIAPEMVAAVEDSRRGCAGGLKLVANLPYDIATPLVVELLLGELPFERLCFTVQAEVADRFFAKAGSRTYGPASVVVQWLCRGRRVCRVPPQAFWPAPKVSSSMLALDVRSGEAVGLVDRRAFAGFVRSFFQHRRKTMANIAKRMDGAERFLDALGAAGVRPSARPEELTVQAWVEFYQAAC